MNKKKNVSFILNIIIFVCLIIGITLELYSDITSDYSLLKMLTYNYKHYTELSNLFMGTCSLVYAINLWNSVKRKNEIPKSLKIIKLLSTTGVTLTFLTVVFYLVPLMGSKWLFLFTGSQLFFHLIIPVLSLITFIFYEDNKVDSKYTWYNLVPVSLYGIFYMIVSLTHQVDGHIDIEYDWYLFMSHGVTWGILSFVIMIIFNIIIINILNKLTGKFMKK